MDVFEDFVSPFLERSLHGFNSVVFVYGHSGSGKTHTILVSKADRHTGILKLVIDKLESGGMNKNNIQ